MNEFIYFDAAATSYPKPPCVKDAILSCFDKSGGNPGRSSHTLSMNAALEIYSCREAICDFFSFSKPQNVIFTYNATYALNMAIKGLYKKGTKIIVSNLEHNSVLRPVFTMSKKAHLGCSFDVFDATGTKEQTLNNFKKVLSKDTGLCVITMASNVCGKLLPVKEISHICKIKGIPLIIDASQSAGYMKIDFEELCASALCAPGHKGLYGPQGTGFCIFSENALPHSIIEGGNGTTSKSLESAKVFPEYLEAGTLATPSIAGLREGIKYVKSKDLLEISEYCKFLGEYIKDGLYNMSDIKIYGDIGESTGGCILFNKKDIPCEAVASALSDENICVRSGLHCAPLAHKAFGTINSGAVRVSLSFGNTKEEADALLFAINKIM